MSEPVPTPARPKRKIILSALAFAAIALVGILIVLYAWNLPPFRSTLQATENALVRGQVTIISPQLSGYVTEVRVQDFQTVKKGELLLRIDDRIPIQRLAQARAELANRKAALANFAQTNASARATIAQNQALLASNEAQARRSSADLRRVEELAADGSLSARANSTPRAPPAPSPRPAATRRVLRSRSLARTWRRWASTALPLKPRLQAPRRLSSWPKST
jgi:multidrug resistance efflux pump